MLAFLFTLFVSWLNLWGPQKPLVLQPAPFPVARPLFAVAAVRDERPGRPPLAWLLTSTAATVQPVDLQGGTETALQQFAARSLPQPTAARYRVTIRVLECRVQEVPAANRQAAGQLTVRLAFDWQNVEGRTVTLTEYRSGARYQRPLTDRTVVETALQQNLLGGFRYLQQWLEQGVRQDARLATAVRPSFRYETRQTEADTLFYDPARPLSWTDFTGQPRPKGRYAAAVFPGFAYQGRPRVVNGTIELELWLKVFVVRSSSWVAPDQRTAYNLNHEQRHFDLVRLVVERFRRKASPDSLTVEDYNSILQLQYLKSFTEMNHLQDQYDQETHGGTDAAAQERWNRRIDAELRGYGIVR
ncbi:hypothetical protein [Hymenobacter rigui]|uniref:DUF922 domain-containing protein n=1 Tax=Hymenobacter rigui TaxID=334424 RepID=A0A428KVY1_9BACT|nr:hypothetical protein [Hymenobacter rigui]RSK50933.1 hypothetical protein EI291_01030 [Hymenobacter rigui]